DLPAGVCGNGVVEAGEACDSADISCGQPDTDEACRRLCQADDECGGGAATCGLDGVCRTASGSFELVNEIGTPGAAFADIADFDGDGVSDLVTFGSLQVRALYLEESGGVVSEATLPAMAAAPAVGNLTADFDGVPDGVGDLVDLTTFGVSVFRGQADETFQATSYSSLNVAAGTVTYAVLEARQPTNSQNAYFAADEVLRFIESRIEHEFDNEKLFDLPFPAADLQLPVAAADVDAQDGRQSAELVLAKKDGGKILVMAVAQPGANAWNHDPALYPPVALPGNAKISGRVMLQDVNGDGNADILATASVGPVQGIFVTFGLGNGKFHSVASEVPGLILPDQKFALVASPVPSAPLALGDVNADGFTDAVFPSGVIVSAPGSPGDKGDCDKSVPGYICARNNGPPWIDAAIGQFNATPGVDIALLRQGTLSVEFLNGFGNGAFNGFLIPTSGFPVRLVTGDFDGDLLTDLAILERSEPTDFSDPTASAGDDTLSVLFSQAFGPPLPPQTFAELGSVEQLVVGRLDFAGVDTVADIGVLSTDDDGNRAIAIFQGSGSRLLQSPYLLLQSTTDEPDLAMRASVGQFGTLGNDIAALSFLGTAAGGLKQRAWLLSTEDEALITLSSVGTPLDLPEGFDACGALTLPMDIDGDGVMELVLLSRGILELERSNGQALVLKATGEPPEFKLAQGPEPVGFRFSAPFVQRLTCDQFRAALLGKNKPIFDAVGTGQAAAAELDGQPGKDVIAMAPANDTGITGLVVYPGDAGGGIRFDAPINLSVPGATSLVGFALIQADQDEAQEVALITNEGLVIAELDLGAQLATIQRPVADLDFAGQFLGGNNPDKPKLLPGLGARDSRAFALLARDIDADGVEDLVLGFNGSLRVLKGQESR
ncbi:MAG TPA: FG-GAP-like repeat-containing protein, partial [Polyangiaceae bacterium]|nr:FG-GAP-like repeat-containing protein [Polyangiaceae bacterium]